MIAPLLGLPKQAEILIIIFLGICFLSLDFSLFHIKSNLQDVWNIQLEHARNLETITKYIITLVVLLRAFSLHAFVAFYIVMLWPAIFEEKPSLMMPWLLLGILRCLILNGITLVTGTIVCHMERGFSPICFEYILTQVIEHGPSVYAWKTVLNFYRELAEQHSNQSSEESLLSGSNLTANVQEEDSEDGSIERTVRSYSMSDLNLDYMHSNRFRSLSSEMPIETLIDELRRLVNKTRIIKEPSKSLESTICESRSETLQVYGTLSKADLSVMEKTMRILDISEDDVIKAKVGKDRLVGILKEVSVADVKNMDKKSEAIVASKSFYIKKGRVHKGKHSHIPKSVSLHEEAKSHENCLCQLRRQIKMEHSNQSLLETEIASVQLDANDKVDKPTQQWCNKPKCKVFKDYLNDNRVAGGYDFGFNPNVFLQKFVLKKNTSKNFGCQVSILRHGFLEESKDQLTKKLRFLRHFGLL